MKFNTDHYKFSLVVAQWLKSYRITGQSRLGREASVSSMVLYNIEKWNLYQSI